jgi:hypothetical protein
MDIQKLTDGSLKDLHALIKEALARDDANPGAETYGVRKYGDWRKQADAFEAEMAKRGIDFDPIRW